MRLLHLLILLFPVISHALPDTLPVPGGIVILPVSTTADKPEVYFRKQQVMVVKDEQQWKAIIGLPLSMKAGKHKAMVRLKGKPAFSIAFTVNRKNYPEQHITIKNKRMVNPDQYDMKRIHADKKRIRKALYHWRNTEQIQLEFNKPVEGIYSSAFGLKRFFNKQARRPHSGLDIAASLGTPIRTPANGTVIETGDYFFNGKTIFIDHGQGLISMYCHLNRINVKTGQQLSQGEIMGEIGKTGRVTGSHLHWSVSLNRNMVDPSLFLKPSERPQAQK